MRFVPLGTLLLSVAIPSGAALAADPILPAALPPVAPWHGASERLIASDDDPWITPSEKTGLTETPSYAETMAWLERLVEASPRLQWTSIGTSAEGRAIRMVVASEEGAATPAALAKNGRPTLLAQGGIHAGEIDGKDAGLMLLRDMTQGKSKRALLDRANFLFIPILNVDGHERVSEYGRVNQRGPKRMGWRTNRRNLNLNRDFAKLETEEVKALAETVETWRPDLYFDLHVTDGVDYRYDITYGFNDNAWSSRIGAWLEDTLAPALKRDLQEMGHEPGALVFAIDDTDMASGNLVWTAPPRFSNGWGDLRHLPSVLVENHSLKPYRQRVLGTYVLLESALRTLAANADALRDATQADRTAHTSEVTLSWRADPDETPETIPFRGIRSETYLSEISGLPTVRWTGDLADLEVKQIRYDTPAVTVRRPAAYYIPAAWYPIAEKLEAQGIRVERLTTTTRVEAERYTLPDAKLDANTSPFEGRAMYVSGEPETETVTVELPQGSFKIDTTQELGTLAVVLLEPQAPDSYFSWGYFGEILQRTEYIEGYVLEPLARRMLEDDENLRREFEAKLASDPDFAANGNRRLAWFYEKTPYYDDAYRVYPVLRSVE